MKWQHKLHYCHMQSIVISCESSDNSLGSHVVGCALHEHGDCLFTVTGASAQIKLETTIVSQFVPELVE